jgi:hypothetical protein
MCFNEDAFGVLSLLEYSFKQFDETKNTNKPVNAWKKVYCKVQPCVMTRVLLEGQSFKAKLFSR